MPSDTIHMHEELRAGMLDSDNECSICRANSDTVCDCCEAEICSECAVKCAGCPDDRELCLSCATRRGYVETAGVFRCEECQGVLEEESELERARR